MTHRSGSVSVLGSRIYYRESGEGIPVVLLHGNPTSSFLWRHVLRRAATRRAAASRIRWIAPDLIGMGRSDKPVLAYRFADHLAYIDGFVEALGLDRLVLVGHDWGVATAVDWWHRHQDRGLGIAFLEGHLRPLADWAAFDEGGRALFQQLRTPAVGEQMVLEENFFIDALLPNALLSRLPANDFAEYRRPYPDPVSRRPLLQWAREIPIGGEPADVATRLATATAALATSRVPKLLLRGQPGVVVTDVTVEWCQDNLPQLSVVDVGGPAGHFLPEDRPAAVAEALATWVDEITA